MKLVTLRWLLLPVAAIAFLVILWRGLTPANAAVFGIAALGWYGLSRRKAYSLDRDRLQGSRKSP